MKMFVGLAFMLFVVGCVKIEKTSQIPSGIYTSTESGSEEKVEIKGSKIVFHIKNVNGVYNDKQLSSHSVSPDGRINFIVSSNEWSILRYDWTFDGKSIWKEDTKTKKKVSFLRRE